MPKQVYPEQHAANRFPLTSWSLLARARGGGELAQTALEEFAARYYRPVYAYVAAIIRDQEAAREITHDFFSHKLLTVQFLSQLDKNKGNFRPFLKQAIRNYLKDVGRREGRRGRLFREAGRSPDDSSAGLETTIPDTSPLPDVAYHNAWVRSLLEDAVTRVREICEAKGQQEHFQLFVGRYLSETSPPPSWRELGARFGLDEKAARGRTETVASHFRHLLRETLIVETGSERMADEEIVTLLALM